MVLIGIFFMRWNVVIGGQLFSKGFHGFTSFKLGLAGIRGLIYGHRLDYSALCDPCIFTLAIASLEEAGGCPEK